jgi:hypothetical protein
VRRRGERLQRFVAAARSGNCQNETPLLSDFANERQARLSTFEVRPLTFAQFWRGEREVRVHVPYDPETNGRSCTIGYCVTRYDIMLDMFNGSLPPKYLSEILGPRDAIWRELFAPKQPPTPPAR